MKKKLLSSFMLFAAATLFVSCTDPAPEPNKPNPDPEPLPTTDVAITAKHAFGSYNEDGKKEGYANFVVALSEVEGSHDLVFKAAGQALVLNLYAPISEKMELPAGKYTSLTDVATVAGPSVVSNLTNGFTIDADKKSTKTHSFKSMELNVTGTGDSYTITFSGVTTGDTKYTCTYTAGKIVMTDITAEPEPDPDPDPEPDPALSNVVTYFGGDPAFYQLTITNCTVDADGNFTSEGTEYTVKLLSTIPIDATNWRPAVGEYKYAEQGALNTFSGSTAVSIVEKGGKFEKDESTSKNMMAGDITITHEGENDFIAVLNVKLGDITDPTAPLTPLELTAGDFKRVDKSTKPEPEPDPSAIVIKHSIVKYHGKKGEVSNYALIMTTCTVDATGKPTSVGTQYTVDLYSTLPIAPENWRPEAGVYNHARSSGEMDEVFAPNTFLRDGSGAVSFINQSGQFKPDWGTEYPMGAGTVTIAHVEGSATGFTAALDVSLIIGGKLVPFKFTAATEFVRVDESGGGEEEPEGPVELPQTTFKDSTPLTLDGLPVKATYSGTDVLCWNITIGNYSNTDYRFNMEIYSSATSTTELPVGVFRAGTRKASGTFMPGYYDADGMAHTGYEDFSDEGKEQYAAIVNGKITISKEGEGYKLDIAGEDGSMNSFKGVWTGSVPISEPAPQAVQQKNVRRR